MVDGGDDGWLRRLELGLLVWKKSKEGDDEKRKRKKKAMIVLAHKF